MRHEIAGYLEDIRLALDDAMEELACGGSESEHLFEEAALLRAFGNSLDGAHSLGTRQPRWEVLVGGSRPSTRRRDHLHLVRG